MMKCVCVGVCSFSFNEVVMEDQRIVDDHRIYVVMVVVLYSRR